MIPLIPVKMGDMGTGSSPAVLETAGVGSCLVVILFDPVTKVGGLAHAMLPSLPANASDSTPRLRYVDCTIDALLSQLLSMGAQKDRIIGKLVGGAHMFSLFGDAERGIGKRNIEQAHATLEAEGIPIQGEETGGTVGRNVHFDLSSGICSVETRM